MILTNHDIYLPNTWFIAYKTEKHSILMSIRVFWDEFFSFLYRFCSFLCVSIFYLYFWYTNIFLFAFLAFGLFFFSLNGSTNIKQKGKTKRNIFFYIYFERAMINLSQFSMELLLYRFNCLKIILNTWL